MKAYYVFLVNGDKIPALAVSKNQAINNILEARLCSMNDIDDVISAGRIL